MGIFSKSFSAGKQKFPKKSGRAVAKAVENSQKQFDDSGSVIQTVLKAKKDAQMHFDSAAKAVEDGAQYMNDDKLKEIYVEYFVPNKNFYSNPSDKVGRAYFGALNAAEMEMLNNPQLYSLATQREQSDLLEMINHPKPLVTNMCLCALIFCVGQYAVVQSAVLCVDFSEFIPNCIAVYLLLIAQKLPESKRKFVLDIGERSSKEPLERAMDKLRICDPNLEYNIF